MPRCCSMPATRALLAAGGYLAFTRVPATEAVAEAASEAPAALVPAPANTKMPNGWRQRLGASSKQAELAYSP